MRKITAGIVSFVFLSSMVVSSTTFSFAEDSVAEDQDQVDVVAEEVDPLEEGETVLEEAQPAPVITEDPVEEPVLLPKEAQGLKLQPETRDASENVVPDAVLRKVINKKLGLGDDNTADVTQAQVESLTGDLVYDGLDKEKITSIEGLQYAKNIIALDLINNEISDISPLSQLQSDNKLGILGISQNKNIDDEDIAKLSGLSGLYSLSIEKTNVSDLSAISDLDLITLFASYTKLDDDDLWTIAGFKNLETLSLDQNGLQNISPLSKLTNLRRLTLNYNNISDISPLANMEMLILLSLYDNNISDITALSKLVKLEELFAGENSISDITVLSGLNELDLLSLPKNNISDITALSGLHKLKHLYLPNNHISDISPVAPLTSFDDFAFYRQTIERAIGFPHTFSSMIIGKDGNVVELENSQNGIVNGDGTYGFQDGYSEATFDWNDYGDYFDGTVKVVKRWTITSTAKGHGTIDPVGNVAVQEGADQTFTFTPDSGYRVAKVVVDGEDKGALASYPFTNITKDHTIEVTFEKGTPVHTITATAGPHGTIDPNGAVTVEEGADQTFTFTPDVGYEVDKVLVDDVEQAVSDSYPFTNVTQDHKIEVTFKQITHTITVTAGENGSINPSGTVTVTHGDYQSFRITPDAGYKIKDVRLNGVSQGAPKILILQNVMGDQTVEATFEEDSVNVTSGGDQSMVEGSDTIEDIKLGGALEDFEGLWVDGTLLTQGTDYTVKSGSTIVTFASNYLKKLPKGTHDLEFHYTGDRVAKTTLIVTGKEENNGNGNNSGTVNNGSQGTSSGGSAGMVHGVNPKDGSANTGDHYPVAILLLAVLSMTVVVGLRKSQKR